MPKVDLANYKDREQAYVKHCLLERYIPDWAYKVGTTWDSLVYVDGFAGPWQTKHPNYADSSFGVAVTALHQCQKGLREHRKLDLHMECILVERDKNAFTHLERFAVNQSHQDFVVRALPGNFAEQIPAINEIIRKSGTNPFRFIFLDPTGWADIPMDKLKPLLRDRSCEVLINLMTSHITRFLDQPDRQESYQKLFGRPGVVEALRNTPSGFDQIEGAVNEYSSSLKLLCGFKYVSSAVILTPNEESIKYFLIYATNHPRGVEVFKAAERTAARIQDDVRHQALLEKTRQPGFNFDNSPPRSRLANQLRTRYTRAARQKVIDKLLKQASRSEVLYSDLFCDSMAFPLVNPEDLQSWLEVLRDRGAVRIDLDPLSRRKPSASKNDRIAVINRTGVE